jgi:hypothetical protein
MGDAALLLALGHLSASPWLVVAESFLQFVYWVRRNVEQIGWGLTKLLAVVSFGAAALYFVGHATPIFVAMAANFGVGFAWGAWDADGEDGPEALLPFVGVHLGVVLVLGEVGRLVVPEGRIFGGFILLVGYLALRVGLRRSAAASQ